MKVLLADYELHRRMIGVDIKSKAVEKHAIKKLCDSFIVLWEHRKESSKCNQDIANAQIKAYTFIKDVLTTKKKKKYGARKNKGYWIT